MKMVMISDSESGDRRFQERIDEIAEHLMQEGTRLSRFELSGMDLKFCTGCFNCWWKHPGRCSHRDGMEGLYPEIMASELVIFASALKGDLPSWKIKLVQDRLIPLLHPYIEIREGECHHRKRYDRYPSISLLTDGSFQAHEPAGKLMEILYRRFALNFHSNLRCITTTEMTNKEIDHDLCTL